MITAKRISAATTIAFICFVLLASLVIKPLFAQDSTTSATSNKKDLIQQRIETRKEDVQTRIETRKENVQARVASREANIKQKIADRKEKIASRQAALKEKLQTFKDKRKAEIAERINTNLNRINTNQTDQMLKHLNTMSTILDKLENQVNQGNPSIKDPDATKAAIAEARDMVANATATAQGQAANDYTIQVTSESKVKADAQTQRTQLFNDLKALRQQVIEAKQKVADAIRVAKSGNIVKEATASGQ